MLANTRLTALALTLLTAVLGASATSHRMAFDDDTPSPQVYCAIRGEEKCTGSTTFRVCNVDNQWDNFECPINKRYCHQINQLMIICETHPPSFYDED